MVRRYIMTKKKDDASAKPKAAAKPKKAKEEAPGLAVAVNSEKIASAGTTAQKLGITAEDLESAYLSAEREGVLTELEIKIDPEKLLAKAIRERPNAPAFTVIRDVLEAIGIEADWDAILTRWTVGGLWFSHSELRWGNFTPAGLEWAFKL